MLHDKINYCTVWSWTKLSIDIHKPTKYWLNLTFETKKYLNFLNRSFVMGNFKIKYHRSTIQFCNLEHHLTSKTLVQLYHTSLKTDRQWLFKRIFFYSYWNWCILWDYNCSLGINICGCPTNLRPKKRHNKALNNLTLYSKWQITYLYNAEILLNSIQSINKQNSKNFHDNLLPRVKVIPQFDQILDYLFKKT